MEKIKTAVAQQSTTQLQKARALNLPSRNAMLMRDPSVQQFWDLNKGLLSDAWKEWEETNKAQLFIPDELLLDTKLRNTVNQAWQDPTTEGALNNLMQEVSPGVFQFQLFDSTQLANFREYLEEVGNAHIPLRPPYGIALNRGGAMLDERSEGFLAAPNFQLFYREIMDKYMRPIARFLFPEIMGYDSQTFGFSIHYQVGTDTSLRLHTDASSVTLNVNLNLPGETFTGSEVDFYDPQTGDKKRLTFKPGMAMIHRGNIAHAAQPIISGERTNFVMWLYGERGQIPLANAQSETFNAYQRWTVPSNPGDNEAPF